jgi:hypothetical protein
MQEYKIIKQVLKDYIDDDFIFYEEEENSFQTPLGIIGEFDGVWSISFDLTTLPTAREMLIGINLIIDLMNHQIMVQRDEAFYSVFDGEGICVGLLWESSIYKCIQETEEDIDYDEAKEQLMKDMIENKDKEESTEPRADTSISNNNLN